MMPKKPSGRSSGKKHKQKLIPQKHGGALLPPCRKGETRNLLGPKVRKIFEVMELARQHTPFAIHRLYQLAKSSKSPATAVRACEALLDRAWGKPPQQVRVADADGSPLEPGQRMAVGTAIAFLREELAALERAHAEEVEVEKVVHATVKGSGKVG